MKYLKNVVTLKLDENKCIGCMVCINVCPHNVFYMSENKAKIRDKDLCMECGACRMNCPVNAIHVKSGVGCAAGIIKGSIEGKEPNCGCSSTKKSNCC